MDSKSIATDTFHICSMLLSARSMLYPSNEAHRFCSDKIPIESSFCVCGENYENLIACFYCFASTKREPFQQNASVSVLIVSIYEYDQLRSHDWVNGLARILPHLFIQFIESTASLHPTPFHISLSLGSNKVFLWFLIIKFIAHIDVFCVFNHFPPTSKLIHGHYHFNAIESLFSSPHHIFSRFVCRHLLYYPKLVITNSPDRLTKFYLSRVLLLFK